MNLPPFSYLQPLTLLESPKCKRCGFYEADVWTSDDVFDEWELCPLDFTAGAAGRLEREKQDEFSAVFLCPHCNDNAASAATGGEGLAY